jgi:aminoglycoside phosphotransferase (APT) family kinase protein
MPGSYHKESGVRLDEVIGLLVKGRRDILGTDIEPEVSIESIERRPYSMMAKVGLVAGGVRKSLYVKLPHGDVASSRASVQREFEVLGYFFERFRPSGRFQVVRPVARFDDPPSLVTEAGNGMPFDAIFRRKGGIMKSARHIAELSLYCSNCGEWLRAMQSVPAPDGARYRIDETVEFIDGQIARCVSAGLMGAELSQAMGTCVRETSRLAAVSEVRLSWMHSDFILSNILIDDGRVCVLDLGGMQTGPACRDVSTFLYSLEGFLANPLFRPSTVSVLKEAFLKGYGWDEARENRALFRLFEIRDSLGGLLQLSERLKGSLVRTMLYRRLHSATTAKLNKMLNTMKGAADART